MTRQYKDAGNPFMFAPHEHRNTNMTFVLAVFEALKTQAVMNKLSGGNKPHLDGFELRRAVAPKERNGIASYWLERHQTMLDHMKHQRVIHHLQLNVGRYGYGDDRGFQLSEFSMQAITQLGKDFDIRWWVREQIMRG